MQNQQQKGKTVTAHLKISPPSVKPIPNLTPGRKAIKHGIKAFAKLVILLVVAFLPLPTTARTPDDVLVMGMSIDDIVSLDPAEAFEFTSLEIISNLYERLVKIDPQNPSEVVAGLAQSWTVSEDGRETRFMMRPGVVFASGHPLTAHDAAWSLRRAVKLNKSPAFILSQFGFTPQNVEQSIYAENDAILVIRTRQVFAPSFLLSCLTAGVGSVLDRRTILDHAIKEDHGHTWLRTHSAGSGAFTLKAWQAKEYVILEANPLYHQGQPEMRRVIMQHIAETATQRLMLSQGDIDIARDLTPDQVTGLMKEPIFDLTISPQLRLYYLGLNQTHPALAHPRVREALRYLINYQEIARTIMRERGRIHQTVVPEGVFAAIDDLPYHFDLSKARALLSEAGYSEGFSVEMDAYGAIAEDLAQAIQASFARAHIQVDIIPGDRKQILTKYRARNHQIFLGEWGSDYFDPNSNIDAFATNRDNGPNALFRTLAWRNSWQNPDLTTMSLGAIHEKDRRKRALLYADIQRQLLADSPFIILFQGSDVIVSRHDVGGLLWGPSFDTHEYRLAHKKRP